VSYEGVARANSVVQVAAKAKAAGTIAADKADRVTAEGRFLRGFYHFEAKKVFGNIPYIDDKTIDVKQPNNVDAWPKITEDLKFAADNLPETMPNIGRANKWAAMAFYAKALMFQGKYAEALPVLNNIIANGKTPNGTKYALNPCFHDNFRANTKNSRESVFAAQSSVNDGTEGENGNFGDALNFPYGGGAPGECCGFFQPSNSLVNSYKVDANGLPLLDTYDDVDLKNDQGLGSDKPFTPTTEALDPRLDWTVGRRGIQYLDWGQHPGNNWIRDQNYSGPYSPKKNVFYKAEKGSRPQRPQYQFASLCRRFALGCRSRSRSRKSGKCPYLCKLGSSTCQSRLHGYGRQYSRCQL
jgi:starch-binding outer membrane protein, SusD/RagB family